ncbi:MAG: EamA family transporter [Planctomycetes bacterium]|jgi:drug/metabolite transporter (DMT)-like permease|nr:EamA family transporter [Planctomycetota bacterium]
MIPARRARLLIAAAALLFSTGGAAIKASDLSFPALASLRSLVAALVLFACVPAARRRPSATTVWTALAYAATMILYVAATRLTTAASVGFLQGTAPLYLLFLAPLLLGERWRVRELRFLLILCGALAVFLLAPDRPQESAPDPILGNYLALGTGFAWGVTLCGLRALGRGGHEALAAIALGNLFAFLAALPFAWPLPALSETDLAVVLWLGVFQIALAYLCATRGLRHVPALQAALLFFLEVAFNPIWTFVFHGERFGVWTLFAGALLILTGLWFAWVQERGDQGESSPPV